MVTPLSKQGRSAVSPRSGLAVWNERNEFHGVSEISSCRLIIRNERLPLPLGAARLAVGACDRPKVGLQPVKDSERCSPPISGCTLSYLISLRGSVFFLSFPSPN